MAVSPHFRQNGSTSHKFAGCSSIAQYDVLQKLGEGTFGEVHMAKSKKTGAVVALKKILMHNEKDGFPVTAIREIKLLKLLSHKNVLRLEEMAIERPNGHGRQKAIMYMVTPYMDHDLAGLLENPDVKFAEDQIKCYMKQLLEGVQFIHNNHILHRDMKAANLLINNRGVLQIADFGLARHYDEPVPQEKLGGGEAKRDYTTLVVTRWYRPPELLLQLRRYTTAIDMWGVGCVFGEMYKRHPILAGKSDVDQIHIIFELVGSPTETNMPGWSDLPGCEGVKSFEPKQSTMKEQFKELGPHALSFMSECLKLDWRRRLTAIDGLRHPYFTTYPPPAKPEDLPSYEASHELDRRKGKGGQKAALPPAPAGGTVGMGANNGDWAAPSGPTPYADEPPSRDYRSGAGPGASTGPGQPGGQSSARPQHYDSRGQHGGSSGYDQRDSRAPSSHPPNNSRPPAWSQQPRYGNELPPRPPPTMHPAQNGGRGPPPRRDGPREDTREGSRPSNKDTYIPAYQADSRRPPPRDRDRDRDRDREWGGGEQRRDTRHYDMPPDRERRGYSRENERHGGGGGGGYDRDRRTNGRYDDRDGRDGRDSRDGRDGRDRRSNGSGGGGGLHYDERGSGREGSQQHRATRSRSPERRDRNRERDGNGNGERDAHRR